MFTKNGNSSPMSSAVVAEKYVRKLVAREARGPGDTEPAMRRLETMYGLPFWAMWHLRKGRAKTVETSLFRKIQLAYLAHCERQLSQLEHEIAIEKAICGNDLPEDIDDEIEALSAKIKAAKQG